MTGRTEYLGDDERNGMRREVGYRDAVTNMYVHDILKRATNLDNLT